MGRRGSLSKVTDHAPSHEELLELVGAAGRVADHSELKPWRLIELRGDDRETLGRAINKASGEKGVSTKPLRAPLLLAPVGAGALVAPGSDELIARGAAAAGMPYIFSSQGCSVARSFGACSKR